MRVPIALLLILFTTTNVAAGEPPASKDSIPDLGTRKFGSDWPRFLGPNGNSTSAEKGIIAPWPKQGLRLVWHKETADGYAMPAISKGRLFLFDRRENTARLTCMKAETGAFLWDFKYPTYYKDKYSYSGGPRCCPVVDGDLVYIYGPEGMLHCLNVLDGKIVWKKDTVKEFNVIQNFFGVGSTPVVEGDLLITVVGGSPKGTDASDFAAVKGNGTGIVALNKRTGKVIYRITDELAAYATPVLATIHGRRWCFFFARGGLVGFNPANGKVDFHFPWRAEDFESVNAADPMVVGDKVLITETYGPGSALLQVKPGGFKVLWDDLKKNGRKKSMQAHWATPVYHEGYVYGCSGRHETNAELRCIELATGKVMWSVPRLTRTSLLLVDGHFVTLTEEGILLLFKANAKKFEPLSVLKVTDPKAKDEDLLRPPCWAAPILSHGLLYLRGDQHLVCLELIPMKK
jgi:outer membrane protein assembly factor BamB